MKRFSHLVHARIKALDVFHKALEKLAALDKDIEKAKQESAKEQDRLSKLVAEEIKAFSFLTTEQESVRASASKIRNVLGS